VFWSGDGGPVAWRVNTARDEHRFFIVDPSTGSKSPAFDHELVAGLLGKAAGENTDADARALAAIATNHQGRMERPRGARCRCGKTPATERLELHMDG